MSFLRSYFKSNHFILTLFSPLYPDTTFTERVTASNASLCDTALQSFMGNCRDLLMLIRDNWRALQFMRLAFINLRTQVQMFLKNSLKNNFFQLVLLLRGPWSWRSCGGDTGVAELEIKYEQRGGDINLLFLPSFCGMCGLWRINQPSLPCWLRLRGNTTSPAFVFH